MTDVISNFGLQFNSRVNITKPLIAGQSLKFAQILDLSL
jgi:hypothetical protein